MTTAGKGPGKGQASKPKCLSVKDHAVGSVGSASGNFEAQWQTCISPCQRFCAHLTAHTPHDSGSIRYVFNLALLHPLFLVGLPGARFFICLVCPPHLLSDMAFTVTDWAASNSACLDPDLGEL
jgi:hypothetical protein